VKSSDPDDDLLRPREAARLFGVRPATLARWSREGKLAAQCTPGAHSRYSRVQINGILNECPPSTEAEWINAAVPANRISTGKEIAKKSGR
jgi:predicted site-specific integrase-resolvase